VKPITCTVNCSDVFTHARRSQFGEICPSLPFLLPIHDAADIGWISSSSWRHVGLLRSGQRARSTRRNVSRNSHLKFITLIVKPTLIAVYPPKPIRRTARTYGLEYTLQHGLGSSCSRTRSRTKRSCVRVNGFNA